MKSVEHMVQKKMAWYFVRNSKAEEVVRIPGKSHLNPTNSLDEVRPSRSNMGVKIPNIVMLDLLGGVEAAG